ncbi:regulator of telomere elongation helicase 1 homolog [Contarinia nasturtii]|uniref:regulator of telomere elongation helicase 1 homolog n=1 Tax=Contarinia nasturtii TaxID=265458 RepID=UPI0012D3D4C1|nr:regulator of telomere elongation helicase 1 homolog [Contarinia nasturtii]XP_031616347.1 regulator of telomere elongation helicase 1 homolog [Contarinia nasturtii]
MSKYEIGGVEIKFPFQPYDIQMTYMKYIIESLNTKQNAALESPTGTGKTLSLLCSTMAWIEGEKKNNRTIPTVIYATRTHPQILQAMRELKKSPYNNVKAAVIASRNQLCINSGLSKNSYTEKIHMCKYLVKKGKCKFYTNIDKISHEPELHQNIVDIEDLHQIAKKHAACPYYISRKRARIDDADIIFMPYNYLIDPKIREANEIDLKNAIVILDEAHNVTKVCEDSASTCIEFTQISAALRDINYLIENSHSWRYSKVEKLKDSLQKLKENLSEMSVGTYKGCTIFSILKDVNITKDNCADVIEVLEKQIELIYKQGLENDLDSCGDDGSCDQNKKKATTSRGSGLTAFFHFLQTVFACFTEPKSSIDECYRVHVDHKKIENGNKSLSSEEQLKLKVLNFWCFSAKFRMKNLMQQNIRCLILTSSTLAPFKEQLAEINIRVPILWAAKNHVIKEDQICANVLSSGVDRQSIDASFDNRKTDNYRLSLGNSIVELCKVVPDGILVFFPSYEMMMNLLDFWQEHDITTKIEEQKRVCVEPKTKEEFHIEMKKYYEHINEKKGAVFMGVLRGKISEGIDFSDKYGRAVVVVGIPYAPSKHPKVMLKKQYMNQIYREYEKGICGDDWYKLDAVRATNQAIGRVIRHANDYGAILLFDVRFNQIKIKNNISEWIERPLEKQESYSFDEVIKKVVTFFENARQKLPEIEPKLNPESFVLYDDHEYDDIFQSTCYQASDDIFHEEFDQSFTNLTYVQKRSSNVAKRCSKTARNLTSTSSSSQASESDSSSDEMVKTPKKLRKRIRILSDSDISEETDDPNKSEEHSIFTFMKEDLGEEKFQKLSTIFVNYYQGDDPHVCFRELFNILDSEQLQTITVFLRKDDEIQYKQELAKFLEQTMDNRE